MYNTGVITVLSDPSTYPSLSLLWQASKKALLPSLRSLRFSFNLTLGMATFHVVARCGRPSRAGLALNGRPCCGRPPRFPKLGPIVVAIDALTHSSFTTSAGSSDSLSLMAMVTSAVSTILRTTWSVSRFPGRKLRPASSHVTSSPRATSRRWIPLTRFAFESNAFSGLYES